ncbi:hypothetical protein CEXT_199771 [Caerostris extrusa]|uniref:Uncharacterized protein n=1 Tax=Caerostris extrusa TaxID=172846 RepID=A0AAV4QBB3_CAEEX|nr:hypothetical protein CEXT_199771 [Caerostris extrusa]
MFSQFIWSSLQQTGPKSVTVKPVRSLGTAVLCQSIFSKSYFTEWISGLEIGSFKQPSDLTICDQIKRKDPSDARDHIIDC